MIAFLKGKLVEKHPTRIYVDVHGVGYEVHIPLSTFDKLPDMNEDVYLLTHFYVREDAQRLFGFSSPGEKEMFLFLLGVSGIGPSIALAALSGGSVSDLKMAVAGGQEDVLTAIPGIGKKTAARIIVELKDKVKPESELIKIMGKKKGSAVMENSVIEDAVSALLSLGYKPNAARGILEKVISISDDDLDAEALVRAALRQL